MSGTTKYPMVERAVRWIVIMLLAEFVIGTILTTVVGYEPHKQSGVQIGFLAAHVVVGIGLLVGSFVHMLTSRRAHLLGPKPLIGFLCIVGAFAAGGASVDSGSNTATLTMALFFAAALVTYGLSYLAVKSSN